MIKEENEKEKNLGLVSTLENKESLENRIIKTFKPREGWEEAFKKMNENNDDKLLIPDSLDLEKEWEW